MLRRPVLLLALALTACQPTSGASVPVASPGASGAPSAGGSAAPAPVTTLHGMVRGVPSAVANAFDRQLAALLPTEPVPNAIVTQGAASATTGADGSFTLAAAAEGWLEARYTNGGKNYVLLGPAVDGTLIDPISNLVVLKARLMQKRGAIAALPAASEVAAVAKALDGAVTAAAAFTQDEVVAAGLFDAAIAGSQQATRAAATYAWAVRTPAQQLAKPLAVGTAKVTTLAGAAVSSSDGRNAQLLAPAGIARDAAGNVYFADTGAHLIRKAAADGSVTTVAGNGLPGFADGAGANAQFNAPAGLAFDLDGNLYVADAGNHAIRKLAPDGTVTTVAGLGQPAFKDGPGAVAQFNGPRGVAVARDRTVYVADTGNHRIRKIAPDGTVSTVAGSTAGSDDGFGGHLNLPAGVAVDGTRLLVADTGNFKLRAIAANGTLSTLAGNSKGNQDGLGTLAQFGEPVAVTVAPTGDILVADAGNGTIRRVSAGSAVTTAVLAGSQDSPSTGPTRPLGVAVADDGTIYVADAGTNRIGVKRTDAYTTFAGNTAGPRSGALFLQPRGVARDRDGNLYIADAGADVIRKVTPAGAVSTFAGSGTGDADGPVDLAKFRGPAGLAFDPNGNLYVAETVGRRIRKIDMTRPSAPIVSTLAGSFAARADWLEGKGATAHFDAPIGVAYGPDDKLYVADSNNHRIRTVAADGVTTTYAGTDASGTADGTLTSAIFDKPTGLAFGPDGTLYVSDAGAHRVRKLTRAGQVSTLAGHAMGDADGQALEAAFNAPAGLAVDAKGTVFVADAGNHKIRQITSDGAVSTVAGSGLAGWLDGTGLLARFDEPRDLVLGGQVALYVVDTATGRLRVVMP